MKKQFYLIMVLPFFLLACENSPRAYFSAAPGDPVVGEEVVFTNKSDNAVRFEWDFGDGFISDAPHPAHIYTGTGSFQVILTAWSSTGLSDQASLIIDVKIPTLLEIEVREYYDEYVVPGASVRLYPTLPDWENEKSMEAEGYTDNDGIVVFSHLGPYVYYVDVWEENHDNYALKVEDIGFIRTDEVIPNKINRFTAWVDYVDNGKGESARDRSIVIRKLERKVTDKGSGSAEVTDKGWEALYERSIRIE